MSDAFVAFGGVFRVTFTVMSLTIRRRGALDRKHERKNGDILPCLPITSLDIHMRGKGEASGIVKRDVRDDRTVSGISRGPRRLS